ncbi:MAG TPA: tetratricopeptide repeat protein, partial [Vicinamibacterales bacterium]|nr:tetratricopeptide repeat protein [Vicinamibacterales bacterium]
LLAIGFAGKELIRWTKDGRRTHIFNPSSFSLALASVALIATHATAITWGQEIAATQARPPYIYELIALVSLPAQILFGVASMTWAAVATTYGFCLAYFAVTGTHYFAEQPIPIAVFFGMHLLFTDPSTAPRTHLGRVMFGVLYGASVLLVVDALTVMHVPAFYDKLLSVPILNLMIQRLDAIARSPVVERFLSPAASATGKKVAGRPIWNNAGFASLSVATLVVMLLLTGTHTTLMRADTLMAEGQVRDALAGYREFVRTDPHEAEGHDKLGVALMQTGQFDAAAAAFERSLQLEPDNAKTEDNLGVALMQAGRIEDAVTAFERSAVLQPDNVKTQNNLGVVLMRTGKYDAAVRALQHAVQVEPMNPEAHDNLGQALLMAGNADAGVESLQRAVELQPDNVDARDNLGVALMRAGRFPDAVVMLERAVELQPANAEAHDNLGQAYLQEGKLKEATASLQAAVAIKPDYADAHFNLAQAFAMEKDTKAAVTEAREALRLQPGWPLALEILARLEGSYPSKTP